MDRSPAPAGSQPGSTPRTSPPGTTRESSRSASRLGWSRQKAPGSPSRTPTRHLTSRQTSRFTRPDEESAPGQEPQPRGSRVPRVDNRCPGDDVVQRPAPVSQQDADKPQPQEQETQRECQRTHDRTASAYIGAVVSHDPH